MCYKVSLTTGFQILLCISHSQYRNSDVVLYIWNNTKVILKKCNIASVNNINQTPLFHILFLMSKEKYSRIGNCLIHLNTFIIIQFVFFFNKYIKIKAHWMLCKYIKCKKITLKFKIFII